MTSRDLDYDFLRFVGMACIVLAHSRPNEVIFQIRNFDVPLMVLLSGMSFGSFSVKHYSSYSRYLKGRFFRLVLPTWIFLLFFYFFVFAVLKQTYDLKYFVKQFALVGNGYVAVWIIRIFVSMAVIAPFLQKINTKIKKDSTFYVLLVSVLFIYEQSATIAAAYPPSKWHTLFEILFLFTVGYGCIFILGLRILQFPRKQLKRLIFLSYSILLICIMFFHFFDQGVVKTQLFKFPPRIYYVSYALSVSFTLLYLTLHTPIFNKLKYNGVIQFIGRSTMWIYLWHWFSLKLYFCIPFKTNVLIKYLFIFSVAILIAFIQQKIIQKITHSMNIGPSKQKMLRTVFTG